MHLVDRRKLNLLCIYKGRRVADPRYIMRRGAYFEDNTFMLERISLGYMTRASRISAHHLSTDWPFGALALTIQLSLSPFLREQVLLLL